MQNASSSGMPDRRTERGDRLSDGAFVVFAATVTSINMLALLTRIGYGTRINCQ